uniref:CCHC-type domain-containing protein n=2 Tax=Photinus pyralis TaxID=7054 RepID=A0A1Y1K4M7_PHOPY
MANQNAAGNQGQVIMQQQIGIISEFKFNMDWDNYIERLEQYFIVNSVVDEKKVPLLLTLVGDEGYALLKNLCTPDLPSTKEFKELIKLMSNHLKPKPNIITERYKFKERKQKDDENISNFVASLMNIASKCDFGTNLENHLRDQIVWGIRDGAIKKRLLGESDLTYKKAVEMSTAMEAAIKDARQLAVGSEMVNVIRNRDKKECFCCGRTNHQIKDCYYRNATCNNCNRKGHLAKMCRIKSEAKGRYPEFQRETQQKKECSNFRGRGKSSSRGHFNLRRATSNHAIREDEATGTQQEPFEDTRVEREPTSGYSGYLFNLNDISVNVVDSYKLKVKVENEVIQFEVDTGSNITAMSYNDYVSNANLNQLKLSSSSNTFKSYTGTPIIPEGIIYVKASYENVTKKLPLFIIPGGAAPILGREWIDKLNISLTIGNVNEYFNAENEITKIMSSFADVFSDKL